MQKNGKHDREQLVSIIRMTMYLVVELREQGLSESADIFEAEMEKIKQMHEIGEDDLFPESED